MSAKLPFKVGGRVGLVNPAGDADENRLNFGTGIKFLWRKEDSDILSLKKTR